MDIKISNSHQISIQSSSDYPVPDTSVIPIRRHFFKMPDQTGPVRIIRPYPKKVHDYPEQVWLIRSLSGMFLNCPRQPSCGAERAPSSGGAAKHSRQQTSDSCLQTQRRCLCLFTVVLRYCTLSFLLDKAEGREGISLKTIPRLHHRIRARRLRILHRREVYGKAMVQISGEEVDSHRPQKKKVPEGRKTEGPF